MVRVPLLISFIISYFLFLQWMPIGGLGRKAALWSIIGVPGIWWIDLQIDGVRRGWALNFISQVYFSDPHSTINKNLKRLPHEGSIIAASRASPIDAVYLAAIFDPVFTASYPTTRLVEPITLLQSVLRAFARPQEVPSPTTELVDLETLIEQYPDRSIVVFPECTTSNGRGILPFSPSLLTTTARTKVFPTHLRYTAPDITTPIPGAYFTFLWNLCSKPTHCIRIRIAEVVYNVSRKQEAARTTSSNYSDTTADSATSDADTLVGSDVLEGPLTKDEKAFLDKIGEALARLGRVKRVGLGVKEKKDFVASWTKTKR